MKPLVLLLGPIAALSACGAQGQPNPTPSVTVAVTGQPEPPAPSYRRCEDAPGPLRRGDPGYSRLLDRDGDGVACEQLDS